MKRVYLDYAASTPVDPAVEKAMRPYFGQIFGNPHALHRFGQEASRAVFEARQAIAKSIGADYKEIIFTGSATEGNNLALRGITRTVRRLTQKNVRVGPRSVCEGLRPRLIVSAIEHESVLETCKDLEREGVEVVYVPVGKEGVVDLKKVKAAINERTVLVSVMHANNEIGVVQPIAEIAKIIRDFRNSKHEARNSKQILNSKFKTQNKNVSDFGFRISDLEAALPLLHTDAAQSFQYLDCDVDKLGIDLLTLSAHKIYGPKGIGVLYAGRGLAASIGVVGGLGEKNSSKTKPTNHTGGQDHNHILKPIITGSGQEFGLRSGTANVPCIVGFAKAVEIAEQLRKKESARVAKLRDYFWAQLKNNVVLRLRSGTKKLVVESRRKAGIPTEASGPVEALQINGSMKNRLPSNLNVYFPGRKAHDLQMKLDFLGVAASPGAACRSGVSKTSYVLAEMGFPEERAFGSLRFSLGRQTTKADIDYVVLAIRRALTSQVI